MDYAPQVRRIRQKLAQARKADRTLKAFSAKTHKYRLHPPAKPDAVAACETRLGVPLPADFKAFLLGVGHGGASFQGAGAGPFYGISPMDMLHKYGRPDDLSNPVVIFPRMSDEDWKTLSGPAYDDLDMPDDAFEAEEAKLYGGLLRICDQGCAIAAALVMNGPNSGRVVNVSAEGTKPQFAYEANFLDWYERWLDEVISGIALQPGGAWFGYTMGGSAAELIEIAAGTTDQRREAMSATLKHLSADRQSCDTLISLCDDADPDIRRDALFALTKFDINRAAPLVETCVGGDDADCLTGCKAVHWYAKDHYSRFANVVLARMPTIESKETAAFAFYVLKGAKVDYSAAVLPFATHPDAEFRSLALYELRELPNKTRHLDTFIAALEDPETRVVHTALQALHGVTDARLLSAYAKVAARYPVEQGHIRVNLAHRLKEFGFESISAFENRKSDRKPGLLTRLMRR